MTDQGTSKQKIGFIGIGDMGRPMAGRLLDAGFPLVIYDVRPEAVAPLVERGAVAASSPKAVADAVETVIVSLPTPDVVRHVALGETGLIHASKMRNYVDLSTTGAVMAKEVAAALNARDIACLDAPVSGGSRGAEAGTCLHTVLEKVDWQGLDAPQTATMVADTAPADLRGTAFGLFNLVSGVAMLVASVVAGWLWETQGASFTFVACGVFAVLALLVLGLRPSDDNKGSA